MVEFSKYLKRNNVKTKRTNVKLVSEASRNEFKIEYGSHAKNMPTKKTASLLTILPANFIPSIGIKLAKIISKIKTGTYEPNAPAIIAIVTIQAGPELKLAKIEQ
jgi:hypothetical protein